MSKVARVEREGGDVFALLTATVRSERTPANGEVLVEGRETAIELKSLADVDRLVEALRRSRGGDVRDHQHRLRRSGPAPGVGGPARPIPRNVKSRKHFLWGWSYYIAHVHGPSRPRLVRIRGRRRADAVDRDGSRGGPGFGVPTRRATTARSLRVGPAGHRHLSRVASTSGGEVSEEVRTYTTDVDDACICPSFCRSGCVPEVIAVDDGSLAIGAYADSRETLAEVMARVRENAAHVRLRRLTTASPPREADGWRHEGWTRSH
ncbi:MAG: hypothetical protein ACOCPT_05135 [Halanaeroarchaeum sp.]